MKKTIKFLSLITAVCLLVCSGVFAVSAATSGSCGTSASYTLNGTALTITGTGAVTSAPWNVTGNNIETVEISSGITSICANAFDKCRNLITADIPASVTLIADNTFYVKLTYTPVAAENPDDDGQVMVTYTYKVKFICVPGSYAETYANENGIEIKREPNPAIPVNPVVSSVVNCTVTLVAVDGYEYSVDGENYQASNVFTGLLPVTQYNFTQRIAAAGVYGPSAASASVSAKTLKEPAGTAPQNPGATSTGTEITVNAVSGGEYSIDGINYQSSPLFENLKPKTEYTVYVRYAETATAEASQSVSFKIVTTKYMYIGDINGDETVDNNDLIRFLKYAAGQNVYVNEYALDCNGDNAVNAIDIVRLKKYLAGKDVTLG